MLALGTAKKKKKGRGKRFGYQNTSCRNSMSQLQFVLLSHTRSGVGVGRAGRDFADDISISILYNNAVHAWFRLQNSLCELLKFWLFGSREF